MVSAKAVRQAIYTRLNVASVTTNLANGSASLFHTVAPENSAYPMVIFFQASGVPTHQFGGDHFDSQRWEVRAVAKGGSSSQAEDVAKAIADALDFKEPVIAGANAMYMAREDDVVYAENIDGETYRHHGFYVRVVFEDT